MTVHTLPNAPDTPTSTRIGTPPTPATEILTMSLPTNSRRATHPDHIVHEREHGTLVPETKRARGKRKGDTRSWTRDRAGYQRPNQPQANEPSKNFRIDEQGWQDFGDVARALSTTRSELLRNYVAWCNHAPGAMRPVRPTWAQLTDPDLHADPNPDGDDVPTEQAAS